jgi:tetratricopeptide (TPR) repeat protein/tRNA A-37 threonylcarbamoyl transferase component Bud32
VTRSRAPEDTVGSAPSPAGVASDPALETTPVGTPSPTGRHRRVEVGQSLGRYVVIEVLGKGAMGEVLRVYDPKLRRELAVKRIVPSRLSSEAETRLVREAQAMAQLTHPNVVAVYDVEIDATGTDGKGVLIAMEYVPGHTLRQWLSDEARDWSEMLAVFRQAGEGLLAAHRAGLVHRDFKPTNVLVASDDDGAPLVKVTDFGLAKGVEVATSTPADSSTASGRVSSSHDDADDLGSPLTDADVVMGTPRYMAPEQHAGAASGPPADQYAFCVALWEALTGQPPFAGGKLSKAKFAGPPPWPRRVHVPRAIVDAILRGLAVDPGSRWPSMADLLGALAHDSGRRRRAIVRVGTGTVVLASAATAAIAWHSRHDDLCSGGEELALSAWGPQHHDAVRFAFAQTELAYADDAFGAIGPRLSAYAQQWAAAHHESCAATTLRGEQSGELMDLRMACLHRARMELQTTADMLADPDAAVVEKSMELVDGLPPLDRCADPRGLQAEVEPPDPAIAEAVESAREELSRAAALERTGQYEAALEIAERIDALGLEHPPLHVEIEHAIGRLHEGLGRYRDAEARLDEALRLALAQGMMRDASRIAAALTHGVGYRDARHAEGRWLGALALSLSQGVDPGGPLEASARNSVAAVLQSEGEYEKAREQFELVLQMNTERFGEDSLAVATGLHRLGVNAVKRGTYEEAQTHLRAALARRRALLGDSHPSVGNALTSLSDVLRLLGELDEALTAAQESLVVCERALPANHSTIADALNNIGLVHYMKGEYQQAADYNRRALEVRQAAYGPEHPDVADSENNVGACLNALGRYAEAETHHRRALEIRKKVLGDEHPAIAMSYTNLGLSVRHQGKLAAAEDYARNALELNIARLGPDHSEIGNNYDNLGTALLEQGKHAEALEQYEKARDVRMKALGPEHAEVARALSNMATALFDLERDVEAEKNFRHAIEIWERELGPDYADLAFAWQGLGDVLWRRGEVDDAGAAYRNALRVREKTLGPDHPLVAVSLTSLGEMLVERRRPREAIDLLERAVRIRTATEEPLPLRVDASFALARALWDSGRDRARARQLAETARADAGQADDAEAVAEIGRWLGTR